MSKKSTNDQLKTRTAKPTKGPKAVTKPKKMKLVKPKRTKNSNQYANPSFIEFPADKLGLTTKLKAEFIKCVSRVGGDEKSKAMLEDTLALLNKHLEARFKELSTRTVLKRRRDTYSTLEGVSTQEGEDAAVKRSVELTEVSYEDKLTALKEAGTEVDVKNKEEVIKAYDLLVLETKESK